MKIKVHISDMTQVRLHESWSEIQAWDSTSLDIPHKIKSCDSPQSNRVSVHAVLVVCDPFLLGNKNPLFISSKGKVPQRVHWCTTETQYFVLSAAWRRLIAPRTKKSSFVFEYHNSQPFFILVCSIRCNCTGMELIHFSTCLYNVNTGLRLFYNHCVILDVCLIPPEVISSVKLYFLFGYWIHVLLQKGSTHLLAWTCHWGEVLSRKYLWDHFFWQHGHFILLAQLYPKCSDKHFHKPKSMKMTI